MIKSVTVEVKGGLGNQLFQFSIGYSLSRHYDCDLYLNTSFYNNNQDRELDLIKYNLPFKQSTYFQNLLLGAKTSSLNKVIHKIGVGKLIFKNYVEEDKSFNFQEDIFYLEGNLYLNGYWQNPKYFENYLSDLSHLLKTSFENNIFCQYQELISTTKNSVALHIRRGDYVDIETTSLIHETCDLNYYIRAIQTVRQRLFEPKFFVFSDDILWCKKNLDFIDNMVFIDQTSESLQDFELIKMCRHSILSNSTFSWWASLLGAHDKKLTILPKYWQRDIQTRNTNLHQLNNHEVVII